MPHTTGSTAPLFVTLAAAVAGFVTAGLRRAGRTWVVVGAVLLAYLAIPGALARAGALDRYAPLPPPPMLLLLALTLTTASLALSRHGARTAAAIPLAWLVLLQAFRIPVELLLHRLYLEGTIPVEMTYRGRNFDILSGLTGLVLGLWLLGGRPAGRPLLLAWNLLGLGLLVNIVGVAVLATPTPFRQFTDGPPNLVPSTFPWIWLPSFLVQVALASHLLVFRKLLAPADLDPVHDPLR